MVLLLAPATLAPGVAHATSGAGTGTGATSGAGVSGTSPTPGAGGEKIPEYGADPGDKLGDRRTWAVQPSGPNGPGVRPTFRWAYTPGTTIADWVGVSNFSRKPLTLQLYATDAFNSAGGGFDLLTAQKQPIDVGTWITFRQQTITIPARSRVDVPFRLAIPANASPGDHVGGVVAALRTTSTTPGGALVALDQRVAARVYLRVDGPVRPRLEVTDVHAVWHAAADPLSGWTTVRWTVRNSGNVRLTGGQVLTLEAPWGSLRKVRLPRLTELLPGSSLSFRTRVADVAPKFRYRAEITIAAHLVDPGLGDARATVTTVHGTARFWAVPWVLLAIALVLVVGLTIYVRRRRARHLPVASPEAVTESVPTQEKTRA